MTAKLNSLDEPTNSWSSKQLITNLETWGSTTTDQTVNIEQATGDSECRWCRATKQAAQASQNGWANNTRPTGRLSWGTQVGSLNRQDETTERETRTNMFQGAMPPTITVSK